MEAQLVGGTPTGVADAVVGDLAARTKVVCTTAAAHALEVDAGARFPAESFAAAKAQRLLGIMVPRALGGEGASIGDVADVCYQLGQACASTGMIYAMHQIKIACVTRHMGASGSLQQLLRRLTAEQLLLASSTTEGQGGGNVRSSEAPIEMLENNRVGLERKATVISYGAYADGIVTLARRAKDATSSDQVLVALLKSDYTLTKLHGWNALGMRGTCSEGYILKANFASDQVLPEAYDTIHARTMVPSAHLLWGSVWTGVAASATARAQAFIRNAMRHSNGALPPGAPQFTKAMATLRTLRGMLGTSLRRYEQLKDDPQALSGLDFQTMITLTKVEASELAAATVMSAMRACGLAGYRNDGDYTLGRHLRDILSSPIMINNDRILSNLATPALMSAIPASLRE
jgi:acyl-CoA dehydrogenase